MLKGSMVALVTPLKDGAVDVEALDALVDWQIEEGTKALVPVGTTGESPTLSHAEHDAVVERVVTRAAGRVPVIAGAGSNNTAEARRLTESAKAAGADAALVVTPYYNKPTQAGLAAHFEALAEVGLPIIIYNIPGRSVVDMSPATMGELAKLPEIVGVKDATGDLARVSAQRITCGPEFIQLSGEDATAHGFNAQGGVGCISVTCNVAPGLLSEMQDACLSNDYATALSIQDRLMPLHHAIFTEPGLAGAKYALSLLGRCSDEVRLPLLPPTDGTKARISDAMRHAGLLN
ncbi:MAG: 4-hydroxy-tetrahydrodipicolinate synthase [Pseudomonadota bacterium]